jgi:hypothetical protein
MSHELLVLHVFPINAVKSHILLSIVKSITVFFPVLIPWAVETSRAVLNHAKKIHFLWSLLAFSSNLKLVGIPCFCPCKCISVDVVQKKVVEEPDMSGIVDVESFVCFQVGEKVLPFSTKPLSDIVPDPLNPTVVDAPDADVL